MRISGQGLEPIDLRRAFPPGLTEDELICAVAEQTTSFLDVLLGTSSRDSLAGLVRFEVNDLVDFVIEVIVATSPYTIRGGLQASDMRSIYAGSTSYSVLATDVPERPATLDIWIRPQTKAELYPRRFRGKVFVNRQTLYEEVRLYVPEPVEHIRIGLIRDVVGAVFGTADASVKRRLLKASEELSGSLSGELYDRIRQDDVDSDDYILASLPRGRGGQIIYHADPRKVGQIIERVTDRARLIRRSPAVLAAEIIQNRVGYQYIHARHAIERNKSTQFDLQTSLYKTDYDVFTNAEVGWYGSRSITLIPFLNDAGSILMACCKSEDAERIERQVGRIGSDLRAIYLRRQADASAQLELLNATHPNSPLSGLPSVAASGAPEVSTPPAPYSQIPQPMRFLLVVLRIVDLISRF